MNKYFKLISISVIFLAAVYFSTPINEGWILVISWTIIVVFGTFGLVKIINGNSNIKNHDNGGIKSNGFRRKTNRVKSY